VAEGPTILREWELSAVTECRIHGVQLVDDCQSCGGPVSIERARVNYCVTCGSLLSDCESNHSSPKVLSLSNRRGERAVLERWGGEKPHGDALLGHLGFSDLTDLCSYLSGLIIWLDKRKDQRNRADVASCRQTNADAAMVLGEPWPNGFIALIERFEKKGTGRDGDGPSKNFPYLYRSLYSGPDVLWRAELRAIFECYVKERRPGMLLTLSSRDRMYARMGLAQEFLTITAAAAKAGATVTAFRRALDDSDTQPTRIRQGNGKLCQRISRHDYETVQNLIGRRPDLYLAKGPAAQRNSQGARRRFLEETGRELEESYRWFQSGRDFPSEELLAKWPSRSTVGIANIARRLGTSPATALKLRDAGYFNGSYATRGRMRAVLIEDYAAFEAELAALSKELSKGPGISLPAAMQKTLKRLKVDLCDLLGFILSGRIAIVGRKSSARGLERLRLSKADIGSLAVEREERRLQGRLGMPEVAAHLGLSDTNIVTALTRIGLLQPSPPVQTRTGKRTFSESDVAAFCESFISLKEISRRRLFGRYSAPGAVTGWLASRGIKPVCSPQINNVPAVFFRRAEVESLSWFSETSDG
jgi:hypothetical protein